MNSFLLFLCIVFWTSLGAAQVYPSPRQAANPWFLSDNVQIAIQNDTHIIDTYSLDDNFYILLGRTSSRLLSICRYSRIAKSLRRVHLNISNEDFPGFNPFRNNSDVAFTIDPSSGDVHITYTFADKVGIQTYSAVPSKFQTIDVNLTSSSGYVHLLPSSRTSVNPKLVCTLHNGSLLLAIYQHNEDTLTGSHAWFAAEFQGPAFHASVNNYYSTERAHSITIVSNIFRVQNATNAFYFRLSTNGLLMQDIRHVSSTKNNMIPRYSATARDDMDNSTYYLYQEAIESNELWGETRQMVLQHLDANDTFMRKMVLVPFVPGTVPYFFMDFKLTSDAVYCMFVSIQPLIFSTFMHNQKRYGGREIVLMKINKTNFQYIAHTGVSSVGDDNGFRLYPETDGSVFIVGTTNANISSPFSTQYIEQNLTTVFVSRFQSFGILSFITQPSLSNASGYRIQQLKNFSIVFTQDLAILYQLIEVYLLDWVRIPAQIGGANSVIATAPPGGGNGVELIIAIWSYPHHPVLYDYNLSYDPPYIESVTPLNGPTTGGTQLRFICQNVAENGLLKQVDIKVGGKPCTNQIKEMLYFTCLVPPGIGTKNSISVRFLGNEGTANVTFSYDPPQIDSVQPNNALPTGGSEISVIGKNFGAGLDPSVHVTIGGRNCDLLSVTHNKITCVTPPGVGQFLDVFVSVSGQNITASAVFYYLPPDIMTIYPTASKDSNAVMIIRGSNFGNDSSQVAVIFTSSNGTTYQPCSNIALIGESFSDILNCTLDGLLPKPAIYNVRVSIKIGGQTSLGTHQFETGSEKKPPVAIPQNYTVLEDSRFVFRLEGNLPNVNDTIEFYITSLPIHGQLFKNDNDFSALNLDVNFGSALVPSNLTELLYIPHLDFNGTDTFDFQLCNSYFCGTSVEIILNVLPLNDPPVVSNHSFTIDEDLTVEITLNYSDVDSMAQGIQMVVATLPLGTLFDGSNPVTSVPYILTNNTLLYTPSTNRHGQPPQYHYSNFTYMAYDGVNYSITPGIITLNVRPLDDFPVASNIFVEIDRSPTVLIYLECVDIDTAPSNLLLRIKKLPVNGTLYAYNSLTNSPGDPLLSVVDDERRRVWFIPSRDFIGRTEFLYECIDHNGAVSNTATVEISVNPVIDCAEEIVFSSEFVEGTVPLYPIDLSNRKVISERINYKIVKYPQRGIFLQGGGKVINEGDLITTNHLWFSSDNSGGADPYGNFTYIAVGPSNTSSGLCNTRFKAVCSQSYLNVFNNNSGKICEPCAPGAVCSASGLFTPYPGRGFWRSSEDNTYLPCFPESACPGMANQICSTGRTGIRCATCETGFYKFQWQCIPCTTQPSILVSLIVVAIVVGGLLLVIASEVYSNGPSMGLLSITINFIQTILIIRNFRLSWPTELVQVLDYLSFVKLNIDYSSPECLVADESITFNYSFKMKLSLLVPFILLVALGLCMIIWKTILKLSDMVHRSRSKPKSYRQGGLVSFIKNFNMLLSIVFISLAQSSLALFDCSLEVDRYYYLDADLSLKCFEKWWWGDFPLAVVAVIVYVIGIPCYFFMLYFCSHQNRYNSSAWMKMKSFSQQIFRSDKLFQPEFQYFVIIQFVQKLLLAVIDMFFTRYVMVQSVLMLYILFSMFVIYSKYRPYTYATLNALEMLSMAMSILVVTLGLVFRSETLRTDTQKLGLTVLILVMIFGFLLMAVFCALYEFHRTVRNWVSAYRSKRVRDSRKIC